MAIKMTRRVKAMQAAATHAMVDVSVAEVVISGLLDSVDQQDIGQGWRRDLRVFLNEYRKDIGDDIPSKAPKSKR